MDNLDSLSELRSKMIFHAYASKDLDAIERAFIDRFGRKPQAFMSRSPFMIRGRIENRRKLVISTKHCGSKAVFVPLILNKADLENTIQTLGETSKMVYVNRSKQEKAISLGIAKSTTKHLTQEIHCRYCGTKYNTGVDRPRSHCGSRKCISKHKLQLEIQRDERLRSKAIKVSDDSEKTTNTRLPDFNLDDPAHGTLQGYVYCIRAENGLCKIGRSSDVTDRFAALVGMSPVDIFLDHVVFSDNYVLAESYAHEELKQYNHHGEWYDFPSEVYDWFMSLNNYDLDCDE